MARIAPRHQRRLLRLPVTPAYMAFVARIISLNGTARKAKFAQSDFPTFPGAIPNAADRPPARVICLAPALARPKRLHYTPSPVRKQAGNQILRNRENIAQSNSQSFKHWKSGQTYFPMFIQPWFVQFHTNHNLISMLATSRIPMRKIWQEFNAVAQIHPPS